MTPRKKKLFQRDGYLIVDGVVDKRTGLEPIVAANIAGPTTHQSAHETLR